MRELETQFNDLGVAVRFVVIGDAAKTAEFCGKQGMADRCIPDPEKATYIAMGLERYNLLRLFSDKALIARRKENKGAGFSQDWGNTKLKDAAQLPGAAYIDAHGVVRWTYEGKQPGDLPTMSVMLQTIRALPRD